MNVISVFTQTGLLQRNWGVVEREAPPILAVLLQLVVPLSLLPACMLWYAGTYYGDALAAGFGAKPWGVIAVLFFFTELMTVAFMGWFTRAVAESKGISLSPSHAYLIASVCPVPLWLSSLSLLVPNLWFVMGVSVVALVLSFRLIYRGVGALCHVKDDVVDMEMSHTIMAAGMVAWALLLIGIVAA